MKYNVVTIDDQYWIELLEEPFEGIRYSYGKVEFIDPEVEGGDAILKFDYSMWNSVSFNQLNQNEIFRKTIGDILLELIEKQLASNEIVYTGGIDEG